jgi:hypothetical protein
MPSYRNGGLTYSILYTIKMQIVRLCPGILET